MTLSKATTTIVGSSHRQPELDGIRGVAILLVLVGHLVPYGASFSKPGVTVFFGLSGYLITRLLIGEWEQRGGINLRAFYIRRFFRLAPALLVVLAVVVAWCMTWGVYESRLGRDALSVLVYISNWSITDADFTYPLRHMWSLSVEEQFYFVWPIVVALLARQRKRLAILTWAAMSASLIWAIVLAVGGSDEITYRSDTAAMLLLIGCAGALLEASNRARWMRRLGPWLLFVSILAVPFCYVVLHVPNRWVDATVEPFVAAGAVVAAIGARDSRILRAKPLVWLGLASYSLYLWQTPVTFNGVFHLPAPVQLVVILLLAWLSLRFIENPLRRRGRRVAARLEAPPPV